MNLLRVDFSAHAGRSGWPESRSAGRRLCRAAEAEADQNVSRRPDWMSRAAVEVEVIRPTWEGTLMLLAGMSKFAWLSMLKNSERNSRFIRSVRRVFLNTPASQLKKPGPNSMLRAELP